MRKEKKSIYRSVGLDAEISIFVKLLEYNKGFSQMSSSFINSYPKFLENPQKKKKFRMT